jgi:predicted dehydrogenase
VRLRVFGDKGSIVIDSEQGIDKLQLCTGEFHMRCQMWNVMPAGMPEIKVYQRFLRSVRSGQPEFPTFEDGFRVQACLDACRKSSETGRAVDVPLPKEEAVR